MIWETIWMEALILLRWRIRISVKMRLTTLEEWAAMISSKNRIIYRTK